MDMTDKDQLMITSFFAHAKEEQIKDKGFTERVMRRLPHDNTWLVRLWTLFCVVVAAVLLYMSSVWVDLIINLEVLVQTLPLWELPSFNLLPWMVITVTLFSLGIHEVIRKERLAF